MDSPIAQHIGGNEILKEELDAQQQYPNAIATHKHDLISLGIWDNDFQGS
jgi:hypothetical protein